MTPSPRRSLPSNPFAAVSVADWLTNLQSPGPLDQRYRAWSAVATLLPAEQAWPHALGLLSDPEPELRATAAHWLAVVRDRGVLEFTAERQSELREPVLGLLADADPDVRLSATEAAVAWQIVTPAVTATVLDLLRSAESETTSLATLCRVAARLPDLAAETVPRLAQLLSMDSAEVRESAAQALAALGSRSETVATELVVALEDEEPLVREFAARALGQHAAVDDAIRIALQAACADDDAIVAAAAQDALSRLGGLP